ncbi:acyl-CoA-binding domain-containing protein 6-like [Photinus pyralis]|uniref:acyl-CoA-binding domain-containing protein 6-like n=1 Tax=Photinus pyralis TaxID=7054 RepID=UPI001267365A|nr:acyl-CoA-binding domain-containing protein 6-like [Photinus pyralis]
MSTENFDDLAELGIEEDEATLNFLNAADHVKKLVSTLDNNTLLDLYGLYKQATEGPCNIPRPSWYNMKARSKWDAWNKLCNIPQHEAKTDYVKLVRSLDNKFMNNTEKWVSVSIFQQNEEVLNDGEKSLLDYVKDGNKNVVTNILGKVDVEDRADLLNQLDESGMGLIHWAADRGHHEIISILISNGIDVNLEDSEMQTSLHYAAACGHKECVRVLLENNADVNLADDSGFTPKDVTTDEEIVKMLME